MRHEQFNTLMNKTVAEMQKLSQLKGGEYAGDDDRLANFKRNAVALGLKPEQVWAVYAAKHWDAIMQYVHDVGTGKTRERLEPIEGRLDDLIVYAVLMKAIIWEQTNEIVG